MFICVFEQVLPVACLLVLFFQSLLLSAVVVVAAATASSFTPIGTAQHTAGCREREKGERGVRG